MKKVSFVIAAAMVMLMSGSCAAFEQDDEGRVKFSFSSLPMFGESGGDSGSGERRASDYEEENEYTYDAMGRKVPVRTQRSGDAFPVN